MEYQSMINSKYTLYLNKVKYYDDMSKFATLGIWIMNMFAEDKIENIEDLIGEFPKFDDLIIEDRELDEDDLELIEMCNNLGLKYKITTKGIKIGT